jgi:hypothetical protein
MVNEKQQLMNPSSEGLAVSKPVGTGGAVAALCAIVGLNRNTHDVKTAFCVESKATLPYFYSEIE